MPVGYPTAVFNADDEVTTITGPTIRRGASEQSVETPAEFMLAIYRKFGSPVLDLAAVAANAKCASYITLEEDSLTVDWTQRLSGGIGWLNAPFDPAEPWAAKCEAEYQRGARLLYLCRGSIDSNWWWQYIQPNAVVYALTPRIKFVGQLQGYPSSLCLCTFNVLGVPGGPIQRWRWR